MVCAGGVCQLCAAARSRRLLIKQAVLPPNPDQTTRARCCRLVLGAYLANFSGFFFALFFFSRPLPTYLSMSDVNQLNVLGEPLKPCSMDPITGYFRNGCCQTESSDRGSHVVCAVMTSQFLDFSRQQGNDLITPRPEFHFPGLKPGDRWCLCALRWVEAVRAGVIAPVILDSTHEKILDHVSLETLVHHQYRAQA